MSSSFKKQETKMFDLTVRKPKVLLIGNGLSRAYNAESWDCFLDSINRKKEEFPTPKDIVDMPMSLRIILLTENHVRTAMKENKEYFLKEFYEKLDKGINQEIRKLFSCGFDYILTTNYSYELEYSIYGNSLTESRLKNEVQRYIEVDRAETKYMLHTFNHIVSDGKETDIWHIHGEARKPDSMIIGSDYYSRLSYRIIEELGKIDYDKKDGMDFNKVVVRNWPEAILFGDVYVLGFGYDYCEQDLWWLLCRKANETRIKVGKTFFYEPNEGSKNRAKKSLLNVFGVVTDNLDLGYSGEINYKDYYRDAINDIVQRIEGNV